MRTVIAFLISPLIVAILSPMAIEGVPFSYPASFLMGTVPVVYAFTALVALPVYLVLSANFQLHLWTLCTAGFFSGFASLAIFELATKGTYAQVGTIVLVENGSYTAAGAFDLLRQCVSMGVASMLSGALFWRIAVYRSSRVT